MRPLEQPRPAQGDNRVGDHHRLDRRYAGERVKIIPNRAPLDMRLDAVYALRDMTLPDLRAMATMRGLSAKGSRRVLILRLYRDIVELEGVVRFSHEHKL